MLEPRPYQAIGRDFLAGRRHALLADQMRVGKTPQAILAAHKLDVRDVTVVCPAIAVEHWHREWRRWYEALGVEIMPQLEIVSYESRHKLSERRKDLLIVDEAHYCKNPDAARTKAIFGKDGLHARADRVWALTGTPAPNHAGELWVLLRHFGAITMPYGEFIRHFCVVSWPDGTIRGTKKEKIPELRGLLAKIMLRRTRADVAPDMPEIGFEFLTVKQDFSNVMPTADAKQEMADYQAFASFMLTLPEHKRAGEIQRAAGDFQTARRYTAHSKVPGLVENIDFALGNKLITQTVAFGYFVEPLEELHDGLQRRGWRTGLVNGSTTQRARTKINDAFAAGKLDVVVGNIIAAGTAIDMSAARHGYFFELDWVPGNNAQAASRLVNVTKTDAVTFDVATCPDTPDDDVQRSLARKVSELSLIY